jgi:enoyl-[acyl-carrier protein] reductase II
MVWASGWKLASAVSNAGGLGAIGAGSMYPEILDEHLAKCKKATKAPFAVNLPLLYPEIEKHISIIFKHQVPIVITSAGNPSKFTLRFKEKQIKVMHVVSSRKFAIKAEAAGCDAVIAEGFEAGGHNGREETASMVLIPLVANAVEVPVIAAGGIATGRQMLAAMVLGAEGVQVGSRFVASNEASSHFNFKNAVINAKEGDTILTLKEVTPVRLLKNKFYDEIKEAYKRNATVETLLKLLGKGRAKNGMHLGNLDEGELEIGQVSALVNDIKPAAEILEDMWQQFQSALQNPLK